MRVNAILFQGNQKNIRVCLSGRNNADSSLSTKKFEQFPDYQGFLVTHGCFPKSQLFSKSTLNLARLIPNLSRFEKICFRPYGREVWEVRFKSFLCILRFHQKRQLTMKVRMKISVDVAVTINQRSLVFIEEINK